MTPAKRRPLGRIALFGVGALLLLALAPSAAACSCIERPVEDHLAEADMVFIGKVVKLEVIDTVMEIDGITEIDLVRATVEVQEVVKGAVPATVELRASTGCCYCEFGYTIAETYLLFVSEREDGALSTHACTPSNPVEIADEALEILRQQAWYPPT